MAEQQLAREDDGKFATVDSRDQFKAAIEAAVASAAATADAQQQQARRWVEGGMPEGDVITPGPADAPNS